MEKQCEGNSIAMVVEVMATAAVGAATLALRTGFASSAGYSSRRERPTIMVLMTKAMAIMKRAKLREAAAMSPVALVAWPLRQRR